MGSTWGTDKVPSAYAETGNSPRVVGRLLAMPRLRTESGSLVWHYMTASRLVASLARDALVPGVEGAFPSEMPIVWFSERQDGEHLASEGAALEVPSAESDRQAPQARIGIHPDETLVTWSQHRTRGGIPERAADLMETSWRAIGVSPEHRRGSYDAVPRSKWIATEVSIGGLWMPLDPRITNIMILCPDENP